MNGGPNEQPAGPPFTAAAAKPPREPGGGSRRRVRRWRRQRPDCVRRLFAQFRTAVDQQSALELQPESEQEHAVFRLWRRCSAPMCPACLATTQWHRRSDHGPSRVAEASRIEDRRQLDSDTQVPQVILEVDGREVVISRAVATKIWMTLENQPQVAAD